MKLPLKLPSKATLTERARKRLDEAKLFEKEFLDCIAKRGLRYAMSVKSPLTIAASLEVYGQVVNALTLPESKATPESLYEYVLKQVTDLASAITSYSTSSTENEFRREELRVWAQLFTPVGGLFGLD